MKKLFYILILVLGNSINAIGQGNLQFNRVITIADSSFSYTSASWSSHTLGTVPVGKVWKIESYNLYVPSSSGSYSGCPNSLCLGINNVNLHLGNITGGGGSISSTIWLKANDILQEFANAPGGCGTITAIAFFSIIEFNIVP